MFGSAFQIEKSGFNANRGSNFGRFVKTTTETFRVATGPH